MSPILIVVGIIVFVVGAVGIYLYFRKNPVDCKVSNWNTWTECVKDANNKYSRARTRTVLIQPKDEGAACPALEETEVCNPVDCVVSDWSTPTACVKKTDGKIYKTRQRKIVTSPLYGGKECPTPLAEDILCDVDCTVSNWTVQPDTACAVKPDGKFYKTQERTVQTQPQGTGAPCPPLKEDVLCPPVNCAVGDWTPFLECAKSPVDNLMYKTRTRPVQTQPAFGGTACPVLSERQICGTTINVDCSVGDWVEAGDSTCTLAADGNYYKKRTRPIITQPLGTGLPCPVREEQIVCSKTNQAPILTYLPISFNALSTVQAITTGGSGVGGISYASLTPSTCTVNATTGLVTGVSVGTCNIQTTKAGDGRYNAITRTDPTYVNRVNQIGFTANVASTLNVGATTAMTASGGQGSGVVTYSSATPLVCSIDSNGMVKGLAAGQCTVEATKASDLVYNSVKISRSLIVSLV